ncbi:hypothetical protein [Brucella ovis]|uniref:hypothetical protein n=1 Tax=Brucella ovis TaxID=236 RepID=UPI000399DB36|nr:hypothetical protein [Brucella ovis]
MNSFILSGRLGYAEIFKSPVFWLCLILVVLAGLLAMPLAVPIGPMYWDTYIYLDAAQRIKMGQIPGADFSTPVGPLGYYLFTAGLALFPKAQLLLLAQWSMLAAAAPLMAVVLGAIGPQRRALAFALLVPFLIFGIFPANVQAFHTYPGLDGFGIYNRQTSLLIYVLVSGLMFIREGRKLAVFCAIAMLCLFLTKITGFLVGGLIGLAALLAGRISVRSTILAAVLFLAVLAILELNGHMMTAYLADIARLVALNEEALLPRFLTVMSGKLDVILPSGLLVLALFWIDMTRPNRSIRFFDSNWIWLGVTLLGGIILETQNIGSQEFIFLWPVLLMIFQRIKLLDEKAKLAFLALAAITVIPTFTQVMHKTLRAMAVAPTYIEPPTSNLKNMARVLARRDIMERASLLKDHYAKQNDAYMDLAEKGQLPSFRLYAELDFQVFWLLSADTMLKALTQFETQNGIRLQSLMTLDFADPFPWLLGRDATRLIQIGADPFRTVPKMTPDVKAAVEATDGVLRPNCPATTAHYKLQEIYADALQNREVVKLNDCWDLLLRPGLKKAE